VIATPYQVGRPDRGNEGVPVEAEQTWSELLGGHPGPGVVVLRELAWAAMFDRDGSSHSQLIERHAAQVRQLLEWGLTHRDSLPQPAWHGTVPELERYIVATLGQVGDAGTVALLETLRADSDLAEHVVKALKQLNDRR
jgi:hypothetical protein